MRHAFSDKYIQLLSKGPFPGQIDPWVENGRYFRQIHSGLLLGFLSKYHDTLIAAGYIASLDWTLQNGEHSKAYADIVPKLDLGVDVDVPDLIAIHIQQIANKNIVTIIEIISPYSKIDDTSMQGYIQQRDQWVLEKGTQFVEIDLTRSQNRLDKALAGNPHDYHVAVLLQGNPNIIFMDYGKQLNRIALPLDQEVIAVELQSIYDLAYQQASAPAHMLNDGFYIEANIPFPSLLKDTQIHEALKNVDTWREELKRLQTNSS